MSYIMWNNLAWAVVLEAGFACSMGDDYEYEPLWLLGADNDGLEICRLGWAMRTLLREAHFELEVRS